METFTEALIVVSAYLCGARRQSVRFPECVVYRAHCLPACFDRITADVPGDEVVIFNHRLFPVVDGRNRAIFKLDDPLKLNLVAHHFQRFTKGSRQLRLGSLNGRECPTDIQRFNLGIVVSLEFHALLS